jgi:hypothetical protein
MQNEVLTKEALTNLLKEAEKAHADEKMETFQRRVESGMQV